ncbi:MAG TPA: hypothetical protein PK941_11965 [Paludibacter sp.]|mgnify:CR=1 FL=1|nr:hypothetical protein [Paludibacter sp.]
MPITVYNPQKGRLETIDVEYHENNTTWFSRYRQNDDIYMITDYQVGILIKDFDYTSPFWIYGVTRADIGFSQKKAKLLMREYQ